MTPKSTAASRGLAAGAALAGILAIYAAFDAAHPLGAFAVLVFGGGVAVGNIASVGHPWIALAGAIVLTALSVVLVLVDYDADKPWWEIVAILSALVALVLSIAWCSGMLLGRFWRLLSRTGSLPASPRS